MMRTKYTFHHDAGHGWLAVPIKIVRELELKVSRYSYFRGNTLYLEEDCDATLFSNKMKSLGHSILINRTYDGDRSPIRMYHTPIPKDVLELEKVLTQADLNTIKLLTKRANMMSKYIYNLKAVSITMDEDSRKMWIPNTVSKPLNDLISQYEEIRDDCRNTIKEIEAVD